MNKLPLETRVQILSMLVEGSSLRSISRVAGVSINTVTKLLIDAGMACATFHDEKVRNVATTHVQCDEIWSFCYAKDKNVRGAKAPPDGAGNVWTWTALDADSKLMVTWWAGGRDSSTGVFFLRDLQSRLAKRIQLSTDGHGAYLEAAAHSFGDNVDFAQVIKIYRETARVRERSLQSSRVHWLQNEGDLGRSRSGPYQHLARRAPEPNYANVDASLHAIDQRFQQKIRKSLSRFGSIFRMV